MNNIKAKMSIITLFMILIYSGSSSSMGADVDLTWGIDDDRTLVYGTPTLLFNGTTSMPFEEECNGYIDQGNNLYVEFWDLPANENEENVSYVIRSANPSDWYESQYTLPIEANWSVEDGAMYLYPLIPNNSDWLSIAGDFASEGFSVVNNDTYFRIYGSNSTANVTSIDVAWLKSTGIMTYYYFDSPNLGPDNSAITIELVFKYLQDMSQWGFHWGINVGDMAGWTVDLLSYNGTDSIPWMEVNEEQTYLYEDDVIVLNFHDFSDLSNLENGISWNGTIFSSTLDGEDIEFDFSPIEDGPEFWNLLFPLVNEYGYNNLTDQYNSRVNVTTYLGVETWNITINTTDVYEFVEIDLTTGLMVSFAYDGSGPEGLPVTIEMSQAYYLPLSEIELSWNVEAEVDVRYIISELQYGEDNYIDFSGDGQVIIHDGDLISVRLYDFFDFSNPEAGPAGYSFDILTSRGYSENDVTMELTPLGFELFSLEGPPGFSFVSPMSSGDWINTVLEAYEGLGYTTINTTDVFGFSYSSSEINITIHAQKDTGLLSYYRVEMVMEELPLVMEFALGTQVNPASFGWGWGISPGETLVGHYSKLNIDNENFIELEEGVYLHEDQTITLMVTALGNLSTGGPEINFTVVIGSFVENDMQIGMEQPGFEFAKEMHGGFPFLYPYIPVGDSTYWNLVETLYTEAGYVVEQTDDIINVEGTHVDFSFFVQWNKTSGVINFYQLNGTDIEVEFVQGEGLYVPPTTTTTTAVNATTTIAANATTSTSGLPVEITSGFEVVFLLPIMAIITIYCRRRRK